MDRVSREGAPEFVPERGAVGDSSSGWRGRVGGVVRWRPTVSPFLAIWPATVLLFVISPFAASGSLSKAALLSNLPFASILAIASVGQTLVVQQRGFDLSVPGMITVAAAIVSQYPTDHHGQLFVAILLCVVAALAAGVVAGIAITRLDITPMITTLGTNAILVGVALLITHGGQNATSPEALQRFAAGKAGGIPNTLIVAVVLVLVIAGVMRRTVLGRRFVAAGVSVRAAAASGIRVRGYQMLTYVVASLCYALAGVLLAGFEGDTGTNPGNIYLLPTVAAVVLGGTSLAGGRGSVVATAVGALFLTQLEAVILGTGSSGGTELVLQAGIIALGMGLRRIPWKRLDPRSRPPTAPLIDAPSIGQEGSTISA